MFNHPLVASKNPLRSGVGLNTEQGKCLVRNRPVGPQVTPSEMILETYVYRGELRWWLFLLATS